VGGGEGERDGEREGERGIIDSQANAARETASMRERCTRAPARSSSRKATTVNGKRRILPRRVSFSPLLSPLSLLLPVTELESQAPYAKRATTHCNVNDVAIGETSLVDR